MGFSPTHAGFVFAVAALAGLAMACSLNPQPLPPDQPGVDGGAAGIPTTGPSDASQFGSADGPAGPISDAGITPPPPAIDAGPGDASGGAEDAAPDATSDAPEDTGTPPSDAPPDSGGD